MLAPSGHDAQPWRLSAAGEAKRQEGAIRGSSVLLLFIAQRNDQGNRVDLGRRFERMVLTVTSFGIVHAHVNMRVKVERVRRRLADNLGCIAASNRCRRSGAAIPANHCVPRGDRWRT